MKVIKGAGKSVLLGGLASGIVSLIPVVNLLNLMLMMWMGVGGFLCVRRLAKENPTLSRGDAALTGGLSGMIGGAIFSSASFATITGISPERLENLLGMVSVFFSGGVGELMHQLDSGQPVSEIFDDTGAMLADALLASPVITHLQRYYPPEPIRALRGGCPSASSWKIELLAA